jgi:hypothetical protein
MSEPYVQKLEEIAQSEPVTMPKQPRMTNAQMDFLRNLKKHPNSLPLLAWPRATTLRKWMRRPRFRAAIRSLEGAFEVEARLLMAGAAAQAAMQLQATLTGGRIETSGEGNLADGVAALSRADQAVPAGAVDGNGAPPALTSGGDRAGNPAPDGRAVAGDRRCSRPRGGQPERHPLTWLVRRLCVLCASFRRPFNVLSRGLAWFGPAWPREKRG